MSILAENALLTRLQLKNFLGITQADATLDNLIHDLINRVSTLFESYCGRVFRAVDYTEYYDGGGRMLFPNQNPINSITAIYEDSDWVWGSDSLIDASDYRIMDSKYIIYDGFFSTGEGSVKLVYNAGYTSLPLDLTQVAIEECGRKLSRRTDYYEQSKTLSDGTVTYTSLDLMPQTKRVLDMYKLFGVM
jgi:hypothetical protein